MRKQTSNTSNNFLFLFSPILPDKHNDPNFGDVIPDNFPGIFDHLNLIFSGIRSSSSILLLCAPLSKLRSCAQTWYRAAHSLRKEKKHCWVDLDSSVRCRASPATRQVILLHGKSDVVGMWSRVRDSPRVFWTNPWSASHSLVRQDAPVLLVGSKWKHREWARGERWLSFYFERWRHQLPACTSADLTHLSRSARELGNLKLMTMEFHSFRSTTQTPKLFHYHNQISARHLCSLQNQFLWDLMSRWIIMRKGRSGFYK